MIEWNKTSEILPPDNKIVLTKIDDGKGCRNVTLLYRQGNLWFLEKGDMYVYYTPTHWKYGVI